MGKKKSDDIDAVADFFGDSDIDWFADDDSEEATPVQASPAGAEAPVEEEASPAVAQAPATAAVSSWVNSEPSPLPDIPPSELPTAEIVLPAVPPPPELTEDSEPVMAQAEVQLTSEGETLMGTPGPTPARVQLRPATPAPVAAVVAVPQLPTWTAPEDRWDEVRSVLVREAAAADLEGRGILLDQAGRVAEHQMGEEDFASRLYRDARSAGRNTPDLLAAQADVLGRLGFFEDQVAVLSELAGLLEGGARAGVLLEAGLVAWRRLEEPDVAVEHLRGAAAADPQNYTSRALLRALLPTIGVEDVPMRLTLLSELAALAEGGIAADAHVEAASIAAEANDAAAAREHLMAALSLEPGHAPAFLQFERMLESDPAGRAALYDTEAHREGQTEPTWWLIQAARHWRAAGQPKDAARARLEASAGGDPIALRELQGGLVQAEAWGGLEVSLQQEAASADEAAFPLFRLGWLREHALSDVPGAQEAYQRALDVDPSALPARDALARLALRDSALAATHWDARLEAATDPGVRAALCVWVAELAEAAGDETAARDRLEEALSLDPTGAVARVASDGLDRVLQRTLDGAALATARRARAKLCAQPSERATWLFLAASGFDGRNEGLNLDDLREALDAQPDHQAALSALTVALGAAGNWGEVAQRLLAAGAATAGEASVAYAYEAARVLADRVGDVSAARSAAEQSLAVAPEFLLATWVLEAVGGGASLVELAARSREAADAAIVPAERAWYRLAAALAVGPGPKATADLLAVLAEEPGNAGALALHEVSLIAADDTSGLAELGVRRLLVEKGPHRGALALRTAWLQHESGDAAGARATLRQLANEPAGTGPRRAASKLAVRIGEPSLALDLLRELTAPEDRVEVGRLLSQAGDDAEALPVLSALLPDAPDPVGVAARTATSAQQVGDADAMLNAYITIARTSRSIPLAAAYAAWTGMQLQGAGDDHGALEFWQIARAARPDSLIALEGVLRGHVAGRDLEGLLALLADERPERRAEALADAGAPMRAARVLESERAVLEEQPARYLASLVMLERLYEVSGQWPEAYDALQRRRALCRDPEVQAEADAKRRWLLAEHLAETEDAWTLYQQLHNESPNDRDVTAALARIAGARGDLDLGVRYLTELGKSAPDDAASADVQEQLGSLYERADQDEEARKAYLDALDFESKHTGALGGLARLAERAQDWKGLVSVLERVAGIAQGERRVEVSRRIARVTEQRLNDPAVAIDRWRQVTEYAPGDSNALESLMRLAEQSGDWGAFVEAGEELATVRTGSEQAGLFRRIAVAVEDHLGQADTAVRFLRKALDARPLDVEAARRLEKSARGRADWPVALEALGLIANAALPIEERVSALRSSARIELEARHDRDAAAAFYRQVLALDPNEKRALHFMASHLYEAGDVDQALPIYQQLEPTIEHNRDLGDFDARMELATFHSSFAELLRREGDHGAAVPRYERALVLNPTHIPSLEAVGPLYIAGRAWKKAEAIYRQLLQLSGGRGDAEKVASTYTALGTVERALGDADSAYKRFNKALEAMPNHVDALKGMAMILEEREDWSNLLNVYNNVIYHATVPADVIDAYMTKGRVLDEHMERQDKAAQHFQRSLDFDSGQPEAYLRLAELALRGERHREAGDLATRALRLPDTVVEPFRARLLVLQAASWMSEGRAADAEAGLAEARGVDPALVEGLGEAPLDNLDALRKSVHDLL